MEWEDILSISWSTIRKIEESRSRAIRVRRAAAQRRALLRELESKREESNAVGQTY